MIREIGTSRGVKLYVDEAKALAVFRALTKKWRNRQGVYAHLQSPQQRYTPAELRNDPIALGSWLFTVALPMRGGIRSDEAFRFMRGLYDLRPALFSTAQAATATEDELVSVIQETARRIHGGRLNGKNGAGTLSYKLEEHVGAWIKNAAQLQANWSGDIRNVFAGTTDFETAYGSIARASNNGNGFVGMQRKIFSLLAMWLQEFGLIKPFPLPVIVDFHALRLLLQQQILLADWQPLGLGTPRKPERQRPEAFWNYPALKITERVVNALIAWSLDFLKVHNLSPHEVSHGIWFLSRTLCTRYYGNHSESVALPSGGRISAKLVDPGTLAAPNGWPRNYRDLCALCPIESSCAIAIPAGPYYDWGVMVKAGRHVKFPAPQPALSGLSLALLPLQFKVKVRAAEPDGVRSGPTLPHLVLPGFEQEVKHA